MYTCAMYRALIFAFAFFWALAPEIVCFIPGDTTPEKMDCHGSGMSACCETLARTTPVVSAKTSDETSPQAAITTWPPEPVRLFPPTEAYPTSFLNGPAPPHEGEALSLILRI